MADKSFGIKQLNLIGASGTPTIESPNNLNLNAVNVAISTDLTVAGKIVAGSGTSISSPATNVLTFGTNSIERVRIDSTGNIGIGTNSPTKALHISQNSDVAIRMHSGNSNTNARSWEIVVGGNASNNAEMVFRTRNDAGTGGSEAARFTSAGNLAFPSGQGIDFSATANSSGTMTSELLSDYEEGTFTPAIVGHTTPGVMAAGAGVAGKYIKIGNVVHYNITWSLVTYTTAPAGIMKITGLPFVTVGSRIMGHVSQEGIAVGFTKSYGFAGEAGGIALREYNATTNVAFRVATSTGWDNYMIGESCTFGVQGGTSWYGMADITQYTV